jgi:dTDP-glucose 4,6-dehydratase
MKKFLVTGGCGFIGSNFIRIVLKYRKDVRIINLDKLTYAGNLSNLSELVNDSRYRFMAGDVCDHDLVLRIFDEENIDAVVHFAAESHVDRSIDGPADFIQTNILGTFNLLEAARQAWLSDSPASESGKRFLHVSTDEVYGSLGETGLFSETSPYDPRSPYSASKASSDHLVSAYFHTYGFPAFITNCSNNYGPYQFPEKLIPLIIHKALKGNPLPVYGDGRNVRDWLFVEDHCRAILRVLESGRLGQAYNIGGSNERQNIEVVHAICDILDQKVGFLPGRKSRRELVAFVTDRAGHDRRYAIDASKIKKELGWEPEVGFEDGIRRTIDWYLDNSNWSESILDGSYQEYYRKMYGQKLETTP